MAIGKSDIFTKISVLKALNDREDDKSNSLQSLRQRRDPILFLSDLIKTLFGGSTIGDFLVEMLVDNNEAINNDIKKGILKCFEQLYACKDAPIFPDFWFDIDAGLIIDINKIDKFKVLKTEPDSDGGKLIYGKDEAKDFNLFLYNTIQNGGARDFQSVFTVEYVTDVLPTGEEEEIAEAFKLVFNRNTVSNIGVFLETFLFQKNKIFDVKKLMAQVLDLISGIIKTLDTFDNDCIEQEEITNNLLDRYINVECEDVIDDSFFEFDNKDIQAFNENINSRKKGTFTLESCGVFEASFDNKKMALLLNQFEESTTKGKKKEIINSLLYNVLDTATSGMNNEDEEAARITLLEKILRFIFRVVAGTIVSPQILMLIGITNIFFKGTSNLKEIREFFKEHKQLILCIIRDAIVKTLLKYILKGIINRLKDLIKKDIENRLGERFRLIKAAINALLEVGAATLNSTNRLLN